MKLILTFEEPKGAGFIVGAAVLVLSEDLQYFKGKSTYYRSENGGVISTEQLYKRVS